MTRPVVHLVVSMGINGQIGIGGTVPWIDDDKMMLMVSKSTARILPMCHEGIWITGPSTMDDMNKVRYELAPRAQIALYHPGSMPPEDFLSTIQDHTRFEGVAEKEFWVMGGARTFHDFMPLVDFHHINVLPYDGPADKYLRPIIPGWAPVEGHGEDRLC